MSAHRLSRAVVTFAAVLAVLVADTSPARGAPGDLDPTFDGDGRVITDFAGNFDEGRAVAIQADGKIVTAGVARFFETGDDFGLARYNTDGSVDTSFDGDGKVTTDFLSNEQAFAVAIQADGKIVSAGCKDCLENGSDFALARYNTDGSLDTSFDGDGKVTTDIATGSDRAETLAIQGDGKIVAAGVAAVAGTGVDFALARYNTDGSLDATFDGDGKVTTDIAGGFEQAEGVAIQEDGKIVAAGHTYSNRIEDFALARYDTDGSLDTTFDGDGKVTTSFGAGTGDAARAVAVQADGRIVAAGAGSTNPVDFTLARYNTDGALDITFGGDGRVTTDFANDFDAALAVAIQGDGKIVAAGHAMVSGKYDFAVARYTVCRRTSMRSSTLCLR